MKKIFFLAFVAISLLSCSKDDNETTDKIPVNVNTLEGTWYISKFIKEDGTTIDYVSACPSKRDYLKFSGDSFSSYLSKKNCEDYYDTDFSCSGIILNDNQNATEIRTCRDLLEGKPTLTKTTLQIEYNEVEEYYSYPNELFYTNLKGIILTRN
jgi:hypothetical protein